MNNFMWYLSPMLTVVLSLVGGALAWGILKQTVGDMKVEVDRLRESLDRQEALFHDLREEVRVGFAMTARNGKRRVAR
jgi:hypothetical protein